MAALHKFERLLLIGRESQRRRGKEHLAAERVAVIDLLADLHVSLLGELLDRGGIACPRASTA